MNKLSVIGMNTEKKAMLKDLMDLGVVEITGVADKLADENWSVLVTKDGDDKRAAEYDRKVGKAESAISILDQYCKTKKPLFTSRKLISKQDFEELLAKEDTFAKEAQEIIDLSDSLNAATATENSTRTQIASLQPWEVYELPLEMTETGRLKLRLGVVPPVTETAALREELEAAGCDCELTELGSDKEQRYLSLWYFKEDEDKVMDVVKAKGYTNAGLGNMTGSVSENIARLNSELDELATKKLDLEAEIQAKGGYKEDLEYYHDMMAISRGESKVRDNLLTTEETFTFDGWVPVKLNEKVEKVLDKYTEWHEFNEPAEDDEIPVALSNSKLIKPMEFITGLYSLPSAKEVDPTAIFTLFYIVFFGIMFADIGYGIILFAVSLFAIKKYNLYEGAASQLLRVLNYCGISSAFWGVMFGSFFGDFITVFAEHFLGKTIELKPLWISPANDAMTLLVFSCGLGVIHLFVGMGIKMYEQIKDGEVLQAINDNVVWYFAITGILLWLFGGRIAPGAPAVGKILTIIGLAGAIILPFFIEKGVGKALGLWNIYSNVTGSLSDILSYSRLLGLGLASASIAQVMNFLSTLGGKGFAGIIMFVLVQIIGHTFNFAINALGSFVHSARLQYVEFFGKFFEGGGKEFEPFRKDTKYVNIIEEGK